MSPTAAEYLARHEIPVAPVKNRAPRPTITGPDVPEAPYPISLVGPVQKGFGRGGKDLGCPTGSYFQFCIYLGSNLFSPQQICQMNQYHP